MSISEMIDHLTKIRDEHGDLLVLVSGYEGDYDQARVPIVKDVHDNGAAQKAEAWWWGRFSADETALGQTVAPAVVIPR